MDNLTEKYEVIQQRIAEGYTHCVSFCLKGQSVWRRNFFKSLNEAKLIEKDMKAHGHRAIWSGLHPQFPGAK